MRLLKSILPIVLVIVGAPAMGPPECKMPELSGPQPLNDFLENTSVWDVKVQLYLKDADWKSLNRRNITLGKFFDPLWRIKNGLADPRFKNMSSKIFRDNPSLISKEIADTKWPELKTFRDCFKWFELRRTHRKLRDPEFAEQFLKDHPYPSTPWPEDPPPANRSISANLHQLSKRKNKHLERISNAAHGFFDLFGSPVGANPPRRPVSPPPPTTPFCLSSQDQGISGNFGGLQMCRDLLKVAFVSARVKKRKKSKEPTKLCEAVYDGVKTIVYGNAFFYDRASGYSHFVSQSIDELLDACHRDCATRYCPVGGRHGHDGYRVYVWNSWKKGREQDFG